MLPKGPQFEAADFKPDVPDDITAQLIVDSGTRLMTAEEKINQELQEKAEYRKRRVKDEKEVEEYRQNARFAQTDYSSFDSEVVDKPIETYYCCWCGHYTIVMECRLKDCATREADSAYCIDVLHQIAKFPGLVVDGPLKVIERENDKLELQYTMTCQQCKLPVAYRHHKNIKECQRIFVLQDAISNDPTCLEKKIQEYKQTMAIVKGAR